MQITHPFNFLFELALSQCQLSNLSLKMSKDVRVNKNNASQGKANKIDRRKDGRDGLTGKQTDRQTDRETGRIRKTDRQGNMQKGRVTDRKLEHIDRQTSRQTSTWTDRQADREVARP